MNSQPSWRDLAIACIASALIEYAELHPSKIAPKDCRKWISANWYPFGQRKYLPYRVWCEECAKISSFLEAHSNAAAYLGWRDSLSRTTRSAKAMAESIGQINLFDLTG